MTQVHTDPANDDPEAVIYKNLRVWGTVGLNGVDPAAQHGAIADPSGGATVDAEARTAIIAILDALQTTGIIAT